MFMCNGGELFEIDNIELRGLEGELAALVKQRMQTGLPVGSLDGERSVRLPHPHKTDHLIKIKGSGFKTLAESQRVEFEVTQGQKGLQASNIRAVV